MSESKIKANLAAITKSDTIKEAMLPVIAGNVQLAFVTGQSGTHKTVGVPVLIALAREDAKVVCVQPGRRMAAQVYNKCAAHFGSDIKMEMYRLGEEAYPPGDAQIIYATYEDLVFRHERALSLFKWATHVVLDEVHEQSADQEIACLLLQRLQSKG